MTSLLAHLRRHPDGALALEDLQGGALSYAALRHEVAVCAEAYADWQVRSVVCLQENGLSAAVHALAALEAGVTLVPVAPFASAEQIAHVLETTRADLVVTDAAGRLLTLPALVAAQRFETRARGTCWIQPVWTDDAGIGAPARAPTALVTFTSGSTARPKGVRLSWASLEQVAASLADVTRAGPADRHLAALPLAVLLELVGGLLRTLFSGGRVLVPPLATDRMPAGRSASGTWLRRKLAAAEATATILVPELLAGLLDALDAAPGNAAPGNAAPGNATEPVLAAQAAGPPLPSLRFVGVGGAVLPVSALRRAAALGLPVFQGYGTTECCSVISLNVPGADRPGSVGRPLPHARLQIAPDGEVLVQGALMLGYLGDERDAAPASGMRLPWPTGDVGHLDAEGYLSLHGRKDNVFSTALGRNLSPEWLEALLLEHPAVRQAVVLGHGLPAPVAVLVVAAGGEQAARAHVHAVNDRLPAYAHIARTLLAPEPFSVANGLWLPTGRPRRSAIAAACRDVLSPPAEARTLAGAHFAPLD